jgi:hypothetical protein
MLGLVEVRASLLNMCFVRAEEESHLYSTFKYSSTAVRFLARCYCSFRTLTLSYSCSMTFVYFQADRNKQSAEVGCFDQGKSSTNTAEMAPLNLINPQDRCHLESSE